MIAIFFGIIIGLVSILTGIPMVLFGILSFFITWIRNPDLNTIGIILFFYWNTSYCFRIYVLRKNLRYITDKESWYK